jgi:endonuclease/exonuclease/phosphatase family metal-dependent hydrolase
VTVDRNEEAGGQSRNVGATAIRLHHVKPSSGSTLLPPVSVSSLRVATYNIHKGVRGIGAARRLEIHNLVLGVEALDADLVFLQEVRLLDRRYARRFVHRHFGWPDQGQADFLAPKGYEVAYRSNAKTRHGEHGNALLSRWPLGEIGHRDVSDHRFEQRGLLYVPVLWNGARIHAVVAHFGLIHASRLRQVRRLIDFVKNELPPGEPVLVAGDFNDWSERLDAPMAEAGLLRALGPGTRVSKRPTFPSRVPMFALDRIYMRGFCCLGTQVPRGPAWARMSDHLPYVAELELGSTR